MKNGAFGFTWHFMDEITWWTLGIAFVISVVASFVTRAPWFAAGCLVVVVVDVMLVRVASHRAQKELEDDNIDAVAPTIMLVGRMLAKAILLVAALFAVNVQAFAGAVVGALAYDITLAVVGSIMALLRGGALPREGR